MSVRGCLCECVSKKCWKNYIRHWVNTPTLDSCAGYSPIAFTWCVAQAMEKILNGRVFDYLKKKKKHSLIYEHQSGFQRNHSTVTRLCFLAHHGQWHMAMDEGANIQSVFWDLSKAYGRVSISGLLSKLSLIGFDDPSLEWFANFLQHRQQCVRLQSITSTFQTPQSGKPQGTVLGPVLFLIFINDLSELIQNQASFFAGDTTIHATDKSLVLSCVSLSGDLDRAASWADRWGMLFSAPKSKHLPIGREAQQSHLCSWKGFLSRRFRHTSTLGLFLTAHLHGMSIFQTFTLHVLGSQEFCDALTEAFHHRLWKKCIQLPFALAWGVPARYGVEDRLKDSNAYRTHFQKDME